MFGNFVQQLLAYPPACLGFLLGLPDLNRNIPDMRRVQPRALRQNRIIPARRSHSSHSTNELNACSLPHLLGFANLNRADLPSLPHMRPAAGAQVELADINQPDLAGTLRQLAQSQRACFVEKAVRVGKQADSQRVYFLGSATVILRNFRPPV